MTSKQREVDAFTARTRRSSSHIHRSIEAAHNNRKEDSSATLCSHKNNKVHTTTFLFLVCLCAAAALLGYLAHRIVKESEDRLARESFESLALRALVTAQAIVYRQRKGPETLASIVGHAFRDLNKWPQVHFEGFYHVANEVIETSSGRSMGLMPLVTPEQLSAFEEFCYDQVFPQEYPGKSVGESSFGKGVYALDFSLENEDKRYHDVNATTTFHSPFTVLTPYIDHSLGESILMANLHSVELYGRPIDNVITCSNAKSLNSSSECSELTDILRLTGKSPSTKSGPAAIVIQPVYPAKAPHDIVAVISSTIEWDEAFFNVFSDQINGVDCVLETQSQVYTYTIVNGVPILQGEGDLHDTTYTKYGQSTMLAGPGLFSATSSAYKLTFYPNDDFFQVYYTNNSTLVVIGAVAILLVTSIMFAIFGHFVRKPFQSKQALFDGKRRFVRFVSHEVRTPLNSICMGLRILLDEMERCATEAAHNRDQGLPVDIDKLSTTLDEWKDDGREVLRNAHNAAGILTDLLAFDKVESGTLKLELSVVKIWPMLQDVVADYQLAAQRKRLSLNLDMSALCPSSTEETAEEGGLVVWPELPLATQQIRIVGDRTKLLQVVRNLISSAIKFTPEDGRITVRPRLEENGQKGRPLTSTFTLEGGRVATFPVVGLLHLDVEDTGTGMTPEQIGQLFGEGGQFNVNVLHAGQGSGLGLYIAKGIAVQHGGALKATSDGLGKGSKFTLTLPVYRQADGASSPHNDLDFSEFSIHTACTADALPSLPTPTLSSAHDGATAAIGAPAVVATSGTEMSVTEAAPPLSSSPSPSPPPRPQSLRILVVDDAKTNRKLLSRMLQRHGHVCDEAEDGLIAVDKVRESLEAGQRYDSILCDYEMPNMNGPTATQAIRAMGCDSFIVGVTGNLFPEDVAYFKESGAQAVLGKPLLLEELLDLWAEYGVLRE